jgi:hypothetical protein
MLVICAGGDRVQVVVRRCVAIKRSGLLVIGGGVVARIADEYRLREYWCDLHPCPLPTLYRR